MIIVTGDRLPTKELGKLRKVVAVCSQPAAESGVGAQAMLATLTGSPLRPLEARIWNHSLLQLLFKIAMPKWPNVRGDVSYHLSSTQETQLRGFFYIL